MLYLSCFYLNISDPSEVKEDQFYDLSSQDSDTISNNSDHVQTSFRDAVTEKANIDSMMSKIRKICESKGKTKKKIKREEPIPTSIRKTYNIMIIILFCVTDT